MSGGAIDPSAATSVLATFVISLSVLGLFVGAAFAVMAVLSPLLMWLIHSRRDRSEVE